MINISGLKDGYVIDHIKAGKCMEIYSALNLDKAEGEVAIIKNAKSDKQGKKDIIKVEGLIDIDLDLCVPSYCLFRHIVRHCLHQSLRQCLYCWR